MALRIQGERQKAEEIVGGSRLPAKQVPSRPKFLFLHYPTSWDFDPELGEYVPQIRTIGIVPGGGGVRSNGDASAKIGYLQRKGGIILDPADKRLGEYGMYGTKVLNDRGREVHMSIFERYERIGNKAFHEHNKPEFRKFQRLLVDSGVVPAMHPRVKQMEIDKVSRGVNKLIEDYGISPEDSKAMERVTRARALLLAMEECIPEPEARERLTGKKPRGKKTA